jgi:hypothetical protein
VRKLQLDTAAPPCDAHDGSVSGSDAKLRARNAVPHTYDSDSDQPSVEDSDDDDKWNLNRRYMPRLFDKLGGKAKRRRLVRLIKRGSDTPTEVLQDRNPPPQQPARKSPQDHSSQAEDYLVDSDA